MSEEIIKRGRGRPKGSLNKKTLAKLEAAQQTLKDEDDASFEEPENPEEPFSALLAPPEPEIVPEPEPKRRASL